MIRLTSKYFAALLLAGEREDMLAGKGPMAIGNSSEVVVVTGKVGTVVEA